MKRWERDENCKKIHYPQSDHLKRERDEYRE